MNKIYSKVWNASLGAVVVASELASSDVVVCKGTVTPRARSLVHSALAMLIGMALLPDAARADVCEGSFASSTQPTAASTALACGALASASGNYATALGNRSMASGDYASAIGYAAQARGNQSIALGHDAISAGTASVAIGQDSLASGTNSVALGQGSVADVDNTVSVGSTGGERRIMHVADAQDPYDAVNKHMLDDVAANVSDAQHYFKANGKSDGTDDAQATGTTAVAAGADSQALGNGSVAVGNSTFAFGENAVAVGNDSFALTQNSVALGAGARAAANNSVALGAGSVVVRDNAVSVGADRNERQIVNVAAGEAATDAVNVAQLDEVSQSVSDAQHYFKANGKNDGTDDAIATGDLALAAGVNSQAAGIAATAVGAGSSAAGTASTAIGGASQANGEFSTAVGSGAVSQGDSSVATGHAALAQGNNAIAVGNTSTASTDNSIAIGANTHASANNATAVGTDAIVLGLGGAAFGQGAMAFGDSSVAMGQGSYSGGFGNTAIGAHASAEADQAATALGALSNASGTGSTAVGGEATAAGAGSLAAGFGATSYGEASVANGADSQAIGNYSVAVGSNSQAIGEGSIAQGTQAIAEGSSSIAIGSSAHAYNFGSLALCLLATANGSETVAIGGNANAIGAKASAFGVGALAEGESATAMGHSAYAADFGLSAGEGAVSGSAGTALGAQSQAGDNAVAVGGNARAKAQGSALGSESIASGINATAVGFGSQAIDDNSIALGYNSSTGGRASTVSVGSIGSERQITNVAAGTEATDAVNKSQLDAVAQTAQATNKYFKAMAGIAYKAKLLPVRVLGHCGGTTADISDAIVWASGGHVDGVPDNQHPAQVINMSLGGGARCSAGSAEAVAIADAISRGTTVVVAAGNSDADAADYTPASCPGVISVAANGVTGKRAFYSNYGKGVTVSAPGGGVYANDASSGTTVDNGFVWSAINDGTTVPTTPNYGGYAGTSQATPHVAGVVAMILSATHQAGLPTPTPDQIKAILTGSARSFPVSEDQPIGAGIVDAYAAINKALDNSNGSGEPAVIMLSKGVILGNQLGAAGASILYAIDVPAGANTLNLRSFGGTGDVSLFVKAGSAPAADGSDADFKSVKPGNNEAVVVAKPQAATYYIRLAAVKTPIQIFDFKNVSVLATYNP